MTLHNLKERRRAASEDGFTLIELLVVIIILGILAAVVVFAVGGVGDKGQKSACIIDTRTLRTSLEASLAQNPNNTYLGLVPTDATGVVTPGVFVDQNQLVSGGFLSEISTLHDAEIADINPAASPPATNIVAGVRILVKSGKCGTVNADVSASGTDANF